MNLGGTPAPRGRGAVKDGPDNTTCPAAAPSPPENAFRSHSASVRSRSKGYIPVPWPSLQVIRSP